MKIRKDIRIRFVQRNRRSKWRHLSDRYVGVLSATQQAEQLRSIFRMFVDFFLADMNAVSWIRTLFINHLKIFPWTLCISCTSHCCRLLPNGLNRDVVWNNYVRKLLKMHSFSVHHFIKILKTSEISIFDARNELSGSILVGKMYLNVQNGQCLQILDHIEDRLLKSKFGWKRSKFQILKMS